LAKSGDVGCEATLCNIAFFMRLSDTGNCLIPVDTGNTFTPRSAFFKKPAR
jgi:hypothetical protein